MTVSPDRTLDHARAAPWPLAGRPVLADAPGEADVAVIGAGAAGIAAARRLLAAGLTVTVVEARDRVGGRAVTVAIKGHPVDLGAHWLHAGPVNPRGPRPKPRRKPAPGPGRRPSLRSRQGRAAHRASGGARPDGASRAADRGEGARGPRRRGDPASGLRGEARCQHGLCRQPVRRRRARRLPGAARPRTAGAPRRRGDGRRLVRRGRRDRDDGRHRPGQAAIVTVPIAVLQGGGIRFTPALPAAIEEAVHGFTAGVYEHVVLHWPHSPFRGADRFAGLVGTRREPPGLLTCIDGTPFHFFELDQPGAAAFDGGRDLTRRALRPRGAGRAFRASRARWPLGAVRHRLAARSVRARLLGGLPPGLLRRQARGPDGRADLVCGRGAVARAMGHGRRGLGVGRAGGGGRRPRLDAPPAGVSGPAGGATACSAARGPAGGGRP